MTEKRYFVVRESGAIGKGKLSFAVEVGEHRQTLDQRDKPSAHDLRIAYLCEIPETMTLDEAVRLYEAGVRVKPPKAEKSKLSLADVLKDKRDRREMALAERARTGK